MDYHAHTRKFLLSTSGLFLALAILTLSQVWASAGVLLPVVTGEAAVVSSHSDWSQGLNLTATAWNSYSNFTGAMAASISENIIVKPVSLFILWWKNLFLGLWQMLTDYKTAAVANWRTYLNGVDPAPKDEVVPAVTLDRDKLKAELKAELEQELKVTKAGAVTLPTERYAVPQNGVVVVPASGNAAADAKTKAGISSMFSDQVQVQFDPSGRAGVITPIFKRDTSKNYLFLLTPVQK